MPEIQKSTRGAIVIDDRYAPLIVTTFFGETDLALGKWFEDMHRKVTLNQGIQGRRVLSIADATHAVKPTAEMRRFWAEMSQRATPAMKEATLATFLVVNSALIRGAITAISWMSPAMREIESFATVDLALAEAFQRLARAGTPVAKLTAYKLPEAADKVRATFSG